MRYMMQMAWKNVFRYARRTWLTSMAMAVGVTLFIFVDSLMKGINQESTRNFVRYESAHANILTPRFQEILEEEKVLDLEHSFAGKDEILRAVRGKGYKATARIRYTARVINEAAGLDRVVMITGIDPAADPEVFELRKGLNPTGRWLTPGTREALVGSGFAKTMKIGVGDIVILDVVRRDERVDSVPFKVVGLLHVQNPYINKKHVFIPLDVAGAILNMKGTVTDIYVLGEDEKEDVAGPVGDILSSLGREKNLRVISWKVAGKDWLALTEAKNVGSKAIMGILFLIAAVGVTNTMLMSYFERIKELGMMRALGMPERRIAVGFALEGGILGALGGGIGVVLGVIWTFFLTKWGWTMSYLEGMEFGWRISTTMWGAWNPDRIIQVFIFTVVVSTLVSIYPARKAISGSVAEVLRYE